jgi:hypothetical protein
MTNKNSSTGVARAVSFNFPTAARAACCAARSILPFVPSMPSKTNHSS